MKKILFVGPERQFSSIKETTIDECVMYCQGRKELALDTETTGLDHTGNKVIMFQIGDADKQFVIDTRFQSLEPLRGILEDRNIIKIIHNAKFDYKFIRNSGIILERVWDTMLVDQVYYCGRNDKRFALAALVERHLELTIDKSVRNQFIGLTGQPFTDAQIVYGAKDVEHLVAIKAKQVPLIQEKMLDNVVALENAACLAFADIEFNGLDLDIQAWKKISVDVAQDMHALELEMDQIIYEDEIFAEFVPGYVQGDLFGADVRKIHIKWPSPTQVKKIFQKIVPELTSADSKILYLHRSKHRLISKYIKYKEQAKIVSSYGESFLKNLKSDNRIHTSFRQVLNTGRVSSSQPKHIGQRCSDARKKYRMNSGKPSNFWVILSQALKAFKEGAETTWCNAFSLCNTWLASDISKRRDDDIVHSCQIVNGGIGIC